MVPSFGIAKSIVENHYYNLGIALPFVCAFYLINQKSGIAIPIIGGEFNTEISAFINIIYVIFIYTTVFLSIAISSVFSIAIKESDFYIIIPILIGIGSIKLLCSNEPGSKLGIILGVQSLLTIVFHALGFKDFASLFITRALGMLLAATLMTTGILWYFELYIFIEPIKAAFGLSEILPASYTLGSAMLIAAGYSVLYGSFEVRKLVT